MRKIAPASPDEYIFADEANRKLAAIGARIVAFTMADPESGSQTWHLTFQCGAKRQTIMADSPFHHDPVEDVIKRVQEWVAGAGAGERYSTDPKYAE
jgi:hypothetical protein